MTRPAPERPPAARPTRGPGLAVGLGVALVLAAGLVLVTLSVVLGGPTLRVDDLVYARTPGRDDGPVVPGLIALVVADVATPAVCVSVVALSTLALCLRRRRWTPALLAGPALTLLTVTVLLGKAVIPRPLPGFSEVVDGDGAFPSGHTATAVVCAGSVAALLAGLRPARRRLLWAVAGAWTLLVAASMVWLHFHWLSDVVGSMLLGSLLLWLLLQWPLRLGERVAAQWRDGAPTPGR